MTDPVPETFPSVTMALERWLDPGSFSPQQVGLPILLHAHHKDAVPPGPLEEDIIARQYGDYVLHGLKGLFQVDGSVSELPHNLFTWAVATSYRHLKREGCLALYGIPIIPTLERDELATAYNSLLLARGDASGEILGRCFPNMHNLS